MGLKEKISFLDESKKVKLIERIRSRGAEYGVYPLTANQYSIWCQHKASGGRNQYSNPCFSMRIKNITEKKILDAVSRLFSLHDVFKFRYIEIEDSVYQYIDNDIAVPVVRSELSGEVTDEKIEAAEKAFFDIPFDLEDAPPARCEVVKLCDEEFILLCCIHHIICDGRSSGIILSELYRLLAGEDVALKRGYGAYAAEKNTPTAIEQQKENDCFWIDKIADVPKIISLPSDFDRSAMKISQAGTIDCEVAEEVVKGLNSIVRETRSNMFVVLSSLFSLILAKWSGQQKIILGSTFFNRKSEEVSEVVGDFASSAPFVFSVDEELTLEEYIRENMRSFTEELSHSDVVFSHVAEAYPLDKVENSFPLYQTFMVYHTSNLLGGDVSSAGEAEITVKDLADEGNMDDFRFDMSIKAVDHGDRIILTAQYSKQLYRRKTIEGILKVYENLLRRLPELFAYKLRDIILTDDTSGGIAEAETIPEKYAPADIAPDAVYSVCGTDICILDRYGNILPESFFGEVFIMEEGVWYSTGKVGRITSEKKLEIDEAASYVIRYNGESIDLRKAAERLADEYDGVRAEFKLLAEKQLVLELSGSDVPADDSAIEKLTGFRPGLIYRISGIKGKRLTEHEKSIFKAIDLIEEEGYSAKAVQVRDSDDVDIVFSGGIAARTEFISEAEMSIKNERISFCYSSVQVGELDVSNYDRSDMFLYPKRKKSSTELKVREIWKEVLQSDDFGIYDNFYEAGGNSVRVVVMLNKLNREFPVDINIADLFTYNTVSDISAHIDELAGKDKPSASDSDILCF